MTAAPPSPRVKVRRRAGRGAYDADTVAAILDDGLVGHLAFVEDRQPFAIPMLYVRIGDHLILHGSPLSRLIRVGGEGVQVCFTVTHLDGIVLARSAFHHSLNYRSVVILGHARAVQEPDAKRSALDALVEHVVAGRTAQARGPSEEELTATELLELPLTEASAKVRSGPPVDAGDDLSLPVWAGEIPLSLVRGQPVSDARCTQPLPDYLASPGAAA